MQLPLTFIAMIACTVVANLLLKAGARPVPSEPLLFGVFSWKLVAGLGVFACAALLYAWVLRWVPLNVAQSFASAQFVAVILASALVLAEPIPVWRWLGIGLIAAGILVVAVSYDSDEIHAASEIEAKL
jgi:drug/metabolite transporter (DMT)-like permease